MNPDCKSIEAELERALFLSGCFQEENYGRLQQLHWTRAARTDRGVHAIGRCYHAFVVWPSMLESFNILSIGQCCSLKMSFPSEINEKEALINRINSVLPDDIQLQTVTKVTKMFSSHTSCSSRRYCYLLPTYVLMNAEVMRQLFIEQFQKQGELTDCARIGRRSLQSFYTKFA